MPLKEEKLKRVEEIYSLEEEGITCPCCLKVKYTKNKISTFLDQLKSLKIHPFSYYDNKSMYLENAKKYKSEKDYLDIKWACNECLGRKKALISNTINEQRSGNGAPIFAFFDFKSRCAKCYSEFIFRKDEWKHWIDELVFFIRLLENIAKIATP